MFLNNILYCFENYSNDNILSKNIDYIYEKFNKEISEYDKYFQIEIYTNYIQYIIIFIKKLFKLKKFNGNYKKFTNLPKRKLIGCLMSNNTTIITKIGNEDNIIKILKIIIKHKIDISLKIINEEYDKFIVLDSF